MTRAAARHARRGALRLPWLLAAATALVACGASPSQETPAGAAGWTLPGTLSDCGGSEPHVVFPSEEPTRASGPGAVVWNAAAACSGGEGAHVAPVTSLDLPRSGTALRGARGEAPLVRGPLAATGAPHGEILVVGGGGGGAHDLLAVQGRAGGPFSTLTPASGLAAPFALTTAYLGDAAILASPRGGPLAGPLRLHIARFFAHTLVRNQQAGARRESVRTLAVALDYRTDAIAVWAHHGGLYARDMPGRGAPRRVQLLASVGSNVHIAALLSDDYRAIVAWSEQRGGQTSLYFDQSSVGVRFGAPRLLERVQNPAGVPAPAASPRLIRLSNESVMIAWAGVQAGHWVVRTAAIDQHGIGAPTTMQAPGVDALLCCLAVGPDAEALVMWTEPQPGAGNMPDLAEQALFAARGVDARPRRTIFEAPEEVAPPGPISDAAVAFDPASDRALAVWRNEGGALQYAIRSPGAR